MKYADPLAQAKIEELEAERDGLRAKVARVEALTSGRLAFGRVLVSDIHAALSAPLTPSEPSQ